MGNTKKYWRGIEELNETPEFLNNSQKEFSEYVPVEEFMGDAEKLGNASTSRRDFLKFLGFSVTAASLAACETPVNKAIPYLNKPQEVNPGEANWYASTFYDGSDYSSILVKTREGRPILIEGNKLSKVTMGGVNARVNASILSLYDTNRYQSPMKGGHPSEWSTVDKEISDALNGIAARGGKIRLLTHSIISPSTQAVIGNFASKFSGSTYVEQEDGSLAPQESNFKHVTYDSISYSGILDANQKSFGKRAIPTYNFHKAKAIVSIGADFIGNWLNGITYSIQYAEGRKPDNDWMSKHYQFETLMSLTGSNADVRVPIKPSEHSQVALSLYNHLAKRMDRATTGNSATAYDEKIAAAAEELLANRGSALVVCGSNDAGVQVLVNAINDMLNSYGNTIDWSKTLNTKKGNDAEVEALVKEMSSGAVDALIVYGVNPAYTLPNGTAFAEAMANVKLSVSLAVTPDETSAVCQYVCPDNHFLESWNDAMPVTGHYSLSQPTISNLYKTRQAQESLMTWSGQNGSYLDFMKSRWETSVFPNQSSSALFYDFWNNSLHDGVVIANNTSADAPQFNTEVVSAAIKTEGGGIELSLYQKIGIGDGSHAANPWLQELPDPITKITWDNYFTMSPADMRENGYNTMLGQEQEANMISVKANGVTIGPLPVVAQPGQPSGTLGLALGYGKSVWKMSEKIGANGYPFTSMVNNAVSYDAYNVEIIKDSGKYHLAATQTHHTIMGRESVVRETDLKTYKNGDQSDYNEPHLLATHDGPKPVKEIDLWDEHPVESVGHRWGMAIDLNTCLGCGACITACHAENNVPVVGKDEIRRARDMHWLRIDRYYTSEEEQKPEGDRSYTAMEVPEANPMVVHQPMMCQHCNHAPCETVCPVAATTHSNEGLNQMAYNRCIGTRYCANNCPYKVRRFNWFNYIGNSKFESVNPAQDDLGRMVLNPDVVVRSRGVMEKCSLCVQRIQAGKLEAKQAGEKVQDGAIQTACAAACPSGSITFGDLNDKESLVAQKSSGKRAYHVLEEVGTQTNISYLVKVRNI